MSKLWCLWQAGFKCVYLLLTAISTYTWSSDANVAYDGCCIEFVIPGDMDDGVRAWKRGRGSNDDDAEDET